MERAQTLIQALRPPRRFGADARCWISFGGNVGDVRATFDAALALLSLHSQIQLGRRSGLYSTEPMGSEAGKAFINSVCELTTTLEPIDLLTVLQKIENQLGRVRDIRWGPRTLDLDILSYGDRVLIEPDLIIPHPALTYRQFVLVPLNEVEPGWIHPICHLSSAELSKRLEAHPLHVKIVGVGQDQVDKVTAPLMSHFPRVSMAAPAATHEKAIVICVSEDAIPSDEPTIQLGRSPGDLLEKLMSAFTAIFDSPIRISDW